MITLKPLRDPTIEFDEIEKLIMKYFREKIYFPLTEILLLESNGISNSLDDVARAIRSGRINYYRGEFTGLFNSKISKSLREMGAVWDRRQGCFRFPLAKMPREVREAISVSEAKMAQVIKKLDDKIREFLQGEIPIDLEIENLFDHTLWKVDKDLRGSLKDIKVTPELSDSERKYIAKNYTQDLNRYIQDWTKKEIGDLRQKVNEATMLGSRYKDLAEVIESSYGVSQNKAKFLARQETKLMLASFKEARYESAGVKEYIWCCVAGTKAHPVRPDHKRLEGKIFSFNNPPVTDDRGNRNNPGQDYNCRCYSKPIVRF